MSILFVDQLTVIDCAFLDAQRGLVGESWIVDIELEGELDAQSMVLDFGEVKRRLKRLIDTTVDHSLLVPLRAPQLQHHTSAERSTLRFRAADGAIEHEAPLSAVSLLDCAQITADAVIAYLEPRLREVVPPNVAALRVQLRHEAIEGAYYHYAHGLKKHLGACQRIAHGHRSRVDVRVSGQRVPALEQAIAARWRDIYIATRTDLVAQEADSLRFAYVAQDGAFALALPAARVHLMDADTTVECIADELTAYAAQALRSSHAGQPLRVRAFEGVMKGAVGVGRVAPATP